MIPTIRQMMYLPKLIGTYKNWGKVIKDHLINTSGHNAVYDIKDGTSLYCRGASSDLYMLNDVNVKGTYDHHIKSLRMESRSQPLLIVDIGANIGAFTIKIANILPHAKIHSIEPISETVSILQLNVNINDMENRVKIHEFGIAGRSGNRNIKIAKGDFKEYCSATLVRDIGESDSHSIPVKSFKRFLADEKISQIDLLKIDCEGAELEILESMDKDDFDKVKRISIEVHPRFEKAIDILSKQGFNLHQQKDDDQVYHGERN